MIIPEDILQKQLCSGCHKYLTVGPIKVYPTRQIICGRCFQDDDLGVESNLYLSVVKGMMFPCVNRYDGCNEILPLLKMDIHESDCHGGIYDCFLCSKFKGNAYDLNLHCKKYHQKETLHNSEFLIDFNQSCLNKEFFYSKGILLFFVHCFYDIDLDKLSLDIIFVGKRYNGNMFYSIKLYSVENELIYKSKPLLCSIMELRLGTRATVDLSSCKFPKKLAICNFFIHEEPELTYVENIPVIDPSFDAYILKCNFKNILEENFEESVYFPSTFYFKDIDWRIFIKRKLSLTDYKRKFGVFLEWNSLDPESIESCNVSATFSVLSSDFKKKISRSFVKKEYKNEYQTHGLMLADWNYIMDQASGFIDGNCINIEIKMRIYLDCNKREVKCIDCNKSCVYCNN